MNGYGTTQRPLEFLKGTQKMVAVTDDCHASPHRAPDLLKRLGRGTIHLYIILT